jgi:ech hydrogenase subunit A
MQTYQEENPGVKDRRRYFFFVIFLFLTGMYGLVLSNSIQWMYFFWEITTFCSFLLIGYTRTPEAVNNSFRTVILNMIGGIAFQIAIIALAEKAGVLEFDRLGTVGAALLIFPLSMLCLAGFTKTAMFPFSSWLLGAMVAPTPVSALLHSSTMVKAGVYLFLRIAPFLGGTIPGSLSAVVGGITFLLGAVLAISQRNAKRVLAYSTISNLGLMVACAGVGTYQTIWVAVFLMIFHAVAKSLMFLTVGTASNGIGSLEIEDMTGLIIKMPRVAIMMIAGICGMFVAPFGMLISKWAAMEAFINLNTVMSPIMIILIAYGSAATIFFWTKWMGTIMRERNPHAMKGLLESHMSSEEFGSEFILTILTVLTCFLFPLISSRAVEPYLLTVYGHSFGLSLNNVLIMVMMIGMLLVIPTVLILIPRKHKSVIGTAYMGGCSTTEDLAFENSLGEQKHVHVKSYYLENFFNEKLLFPAGVIITAILIMVLVGASVL